MVEEITSIDTLAEVQEEPVQEEVVDKAAEREQKARQNYENLRLMAEREAFRAQQAEEKLKQYEQQKNTSDEDADLDSDDIMDKKEFKKYYKKINENHKTAAQETERLRKEVQYYQNIATEEILKNKFKGFTKVVNETTLAKLKEEDPVLFKSIMANETLMDRGEAAYKILSIHESGRKNYDEQNARLEENRLKPKAAATIGGREATVDPLSTYQDKKRWKADYK